MDVIILFMLFGFIAQIIDGTIGMGYGVILTTLLISMGIPPVSASASVHAAEIATTGVSGLSHQLHGNVDWKLVKKLLIPGVLGAILGAYLLTQLPGEKIKPFIALYLLAMGVFILWKAFRKAKASGHTKGIRILGFVGGFFDAIGGGGWGSIVTTQLVVQGKQPRLVIGSVNLTEFFVTVSQSIAFVLIIGLQYWKIIAGLLIGGAIAAPFAATLCKKLPAKILMILVGLLVVVLSMRTIIITWFYIN